MQQPIYKVINMVHAALLLALWLMCNGFMFQQCCLAGHAGALVKNSIHACSMENFITGWRKMRLEQDGAVPRSPSSCAIADVVAVP
jgi:hypothetical protein